MTATVTDRALRYRAVQLIPDHAKVCAFCGQRQSLMVGHLDGHEENLEPDNLTWTCRSCNSVASNTLQKANLGRRTRQFNPGAKSVGQWMQAVGAITPHVDRGERGLASDMSVSDAVSIIRATPHSKRSEFASRLRHNPAKKQNLFGLGKQKEDYWVEGVGSFATKAQALKAAQKEADETQRPTEIRWKQGFHSHSKRLAPKKSREKSRESRGTSEVVAGSYGGYRIMKTPEGEFYSSLDPDSLFETKRKVQSFIDWYKKGRDNPADAFWFIVNTRSGLKVERASDPTELKGQRLDGPFEKQSEAATALKRWNPAKFDRCVKKVKAKGGAANAYAVCKSALKKKRANPADAAVEAFEEFHGHPPDEIVEVKRKVHFHSHLAGAGVLKRLDVKGIDRQHHIIQGFRGALLAFNEAKNQLFVEGGDQSINLEDFGIRKPHELETLGKVKHIDYATRKDHLGDEGGDAVYTHQFRTTNENGEHVVVTIARYPDLIYRVRDEQLEFSGGSYEIRAEGIDK